MNYTEFLESKIMSLKHQFATAAIQGAASTALDSEFLAQRAWDIAEAMIKYMPPEPEVEDKTPHQIMDDFLNRHSEKPEEETSQVAPAILNGSPKPEKKTGVPKMQSPPPPPPKKYLLDLLKAKGKTTDQLLQETSLTYPQLIYKLNQLKKKGKVEVEKSAKPYLWTLPRAKEELDDKVFSRKLSFARSLGYENITEAISKEGPFEFAEKYQNWKG